MIPNKIQTIENEINTLLINEVNKIKSSCDSRGCKIKYNRCLFVKAFIKRLKTGNTWYNLQNEFKISKTHLHRVFTLWSDFNVFKNVYNTFLKKYKCYIDNDEVYIDSSIIINKYGYTNTTGINTYEARKHRSNKISCIVSKNGIPLGIKVTNSQIHDIKILYDTLPKKTFFTKLIGDKGYISKSIKKQLKRNRRIDLITNYRKNQKNKIHTDISSRISIEHFNSLIKQNRIINIRYDKSLESYENIVYLGCLYRSLQIVFNILYIQ
jgi:hypothetical protein